MNNTISSLNVSSPGFLPQEVGAPALPKRGTVAEGSVLSVAVPPSPQPAESGSPEQDKLDKSVFEQSRDALKQAVDHANKTLTSNAVSELRFSIDEETGITMVKIIDRETGDLIRQIPSEEMLQIAKSIDQMRGALIRQTV